jgi:hypothetical protein
MPQPERARRLGFGAEFEERNRWRSRAELQQRILKEIERAVPAVLADLANCALDHYRSLPDNNVHPPLRLPTPMGNVELVAPPPPWAWNTVEQRADAGDAAFAAVRQALDAWARKWIKDVPYWMMLYALATLHSWRAATPLPNERRWAPLDIDTMATDHSPTLEEPPVFQFEHEGWRFWKEQEADWVERLDAAYSRARDAYVAQSKATAVSFNLVPTPEKRAASDWHVEAFVRYQVLGRSKSELAAAHGRTTDAVDQALREIAEDARIALRKERTGRPPGSRDARTRPRR